MFGLIVQTVGLALSTVVPIVVASAASPEFRWKEALVAGVALTPINLLYAPIGAQLGTLIGVLPGIGPVATIAMLLLGFVLGPMLEENLRRTLLLSRGDASVFLTRPLSAVLLAAAVLRVVIITLRDIRRRFGATRLAK